MALQERNRGFGSSDRPAAPSAWPSLRRAEHPAGGSRLLLRSRQQQAVDQRGRSRQRAAVVGIAIAAGAIAWIWLVVTR